MNAKIDVLLLSTSTLYGQGLLEYALEPISDWLDGAREILFVPYALADHDAYTESVAAALAPLGVRVRGIHTHADPAAAVAGAARIFVGGGNTFRLLDTLQRGDLMGPIRDAVLTNGTKYLGSSAGTNLAGPTIRTTNDMPIAQPTSFEALRLIPLQLNPHYLDPIPSLPHMGETREERLTEFLEENDGPVLGIREGAWLRTDGASIHLQGHTARLFRRGHDPLELSPSSDLAWVVSRLV